VYHFLIVFIFEANIIFLLTKKPILLFVSFLQSCIITITINWGNRKV